MDILADFLLFHLNRQGPELQEAYCRRYGIREPLDDIATVLVSMPCFRMICALLTLLGNIPATLTHRISLIRTVVAQDAVVANRGIGLQQTRGGAQRRQRAFATRVSLEERRRRAAAVMVSDFRKGRLGRLTFEIGS